MHYTDFLLEFEVEILLYFWMESKVFIFIQEKKSFYLCFHDDVWESLS